MIRQDEADSFFKKTANDYFNKLREIEITIREVKENKAVEKLDSKLGIIEGELIDLKNKGRNNTRASMISGALGLSSISGG